MEKQITPITPALPTNFLEALKALVTSEEEKIQLQLEVTQKETEIKTLEPKAVVYDAFINSKGYQSMNEVAKVLGWGRNKLFAHLRDMNIFMSNNTPYQRYCDSGYFVVKENMVARGNISFLNTQTFVTPKGVEYLKKVI